MAQASTTKPYRLLGVDPGTNLLGFAILEVEGRKLRILEMGVIRLSKFADHAKRLQRIF
ncbi:MAG: crossover junction endodeoxyribonuclease RuvC, partial [Bacteroidetes bacterium]